MQLDNLYSELCINVINSFNKLQHYLEIVTTCICNDDAKLPIWFQSPTELNLKQTTTQRAQVSLFIQQLEYLDCQDPKEILVGPGIIASSVKTIAAIEQLNIAKAQFKQDMLTLKSSKISLKDQRLNAYFTANFVQRPNNVNQTLHKIGLARLHLKQCYRTIPYFMQAPEKISWTWAHTKAITKITLKEAYQRLQKLAKKDPSISWQLNKCLNLPETEHVAVIQELAPHLRANLLFFKQQSKEFYRKMVKGAMPLFYLHDSIDNKFPNVIIPKAKHQKDKLRQQRNDTKISSEVFLPALRAHRYLKNCDHLAETQCP